MGGNFVDYYDLLEISPEASTREVTQAFHKAARKYHPDRNAGASSENMAIVNVTKEVLQDFQRRLEYNKVWKKMMEKRRKEGGVSKGRVEKKKDKSAQSGTFFKSNHTAGSTKKEKSTSDESPPTDQLVRDVYVTLEEVAMGVTKEIQISRPSLKPGVESPERTTLSIEVQPGWKAGTKVTIHKDIQPWKNPTHDLVFVIRDKPHPLFTRDGSNILYTAKVDWSIIALQSPIEIPTLTGDKIRTIVPEEFVTNPGIATTFKGHGLPIPNKPGEKGDLVVTFAV